MRVFFFFIALVITISLSAQDEYHAIHEDDQILVSYKVIEVKSKGALLPQIRLSIENKTEKYINVSFEVNLHFDMEFIEAFKVSDQCIPPGNTVKGKIKGLYYNPETLTYAQLISESFEIVGEEFIVKHVEICK